MNKYLDRLADKGKIGRRGIVSEKSLAKKLGARLTPASGAIDTFKGDFSVGKFLMEAKSTIAYSMAIKLDWLVKITSEAKAQKKHPALTITFTHDNGKPVAGGEWVCIPLKVWQQMTEEPDAEA